MFALCPICTGEYEGGEAECPVCGCNLVPGTIQPDAQDEKLSYGDGDEELVELCRPRTFPVAMLVKQMLEQNGVGVLVKGAHSMSVMPHLAFSGELRVLVRSGQIDFARELYSAYFEGSGESALTESEYPEED